MKPLRKYGRSVLLVTSNSASEYKLPRELAKFLYPFYPVREFYFYIPLEVHTVGAWLLQRPTRNKHLID